VVKWHLPLLAGLPSHNGYPRFLLPFVWHFWCSQVHVPSCCLQSRLFILVLARLLMFFLGKMISSMVICSVQKSRTSPNSYMVQPRMRSYTDLVILFFILNNIRDNSVFLTIPLVRKLPFDICHASGTCLIK